MRFPSPDVRLLTLSKLRGVNPTSAISEIDPEAICIELEDKEGEKSVVVSYATRSIIPTATMSVKEEANKMKEDLKETSEIDEGKNKPNSRKNKDASSAEDDINGSVYHQ